MLSGYDYLVPLYAVLIEYLFYGFIRSRCYFIDHTPRKTYQLPVFDVFLKTFISQASFRPCFSKIDYCAFKFFTVMRKIIHGKHRNWFASRQESFIKQCRNHPHICSCSFRACIQILFNCFENSSQWIPQFVSLLCNGETYHLQTVRSEYFSQNFIIVIKSFTHFQRLAHTSDDPFFALHIRSQSK